MKYYISKPISHKLDDSIVIGVKEMDSEAVFVKSLYDADICIFQKGWTRSKVCVADYHSAGDNHIKRYESYIFTDKYRVKLN